MLKAGGDMGRKALVVKFFTEPFVVFISFACS
jgi:hypothetical protein